MYNVKDMVKDGKKVKFKSFRGDKLFYETECGFVFAVPISDTNEAEYLAEEKAMLFMKYINEAVKELNEELKENIG